MCLLLFSAPTTAQPTIDHAGLRCLRPGQFVIVVSGIDPEEDIETAKVYFRSSLYPDFYYVEMTYEEGRYVGVLPQPTNATPEVVYYMEALDHSFNTARSPEFHAVVEDECRKEPAAAYLAGGSPAITVGAVVSGTAALPPGFAATGIVGSITAAGVASGVGGGISAGTAVVVGAAAAGAAGAAAATVGGGDNPMSPTSTAVAVSPTTSSGTTSTVAGGTSSTTTSSVSVSTSSTSTTSTVTSTTPGGPTTTTTAPGTSTSTITVPTTTTTSPGALDASCFTVQVLGRCKVRLDATCVALPVDRYEWIVDLNDQWKKVNFSNGPATLIHTWDPADCGVDTVLRFRLKVRRGVETSTFVKDFFVPGDGVATRIVPSQTGVRVQAVLTLDGVSGRGRVLLNGALLGVVESGQLVELRGRAILGKNTLTAFLTHPSTATGRWRFDFSEEPKLVPGSLRVRSGRVLSLESNAVVLAPGARIELAFELGK